MSNWILHVCNLRFDIYLKFEIWNLSFIMGASMKVLVTGGCGFLGSHVCEYYAKKGDSVVSYDNMTKYELERTGYDKDKARSYNKKFLEKLGVQILEKDIRNQADLKKAAKGCDFIVHTAAQPAMTISWEDPELDFSTNCLGTFNVLEAARAFKIPVVSCATIHIYGNKINDELKETENRYVREPESIDEDYPLLGGTLTPLHASKSSADTYIKTYIDTYKLDAASFRLSGLYGPRQFGGEDHGWAANFCIRAVKGLPINIYGTGKQVRDILFAVDVCEAFDAFYKTRKSGVYNIGGGKKTAISLLDCIDIIEKVLSKKPKVEFAPERLGDLRYFICDINKAKAQLGWEPMIMPKDGVRRLIEWVGENKDIFNALAC
jgi:CDP-paratose 2-epimerase